MINMTKEEKIGEICQNSINLLGTPLSEAIAHAITEGYKLGWNDCYKAFKLDKLEQ